MPENENTVDVTLPEAADDAQQNEGESLSNIAEETQEEQPQKDAGWFRQRIDKAKAQAIADYKAQHDTEVAELRAEIEELRAERLERKAQELVDSGDIKNLEMAKEYLTYKSGRKFTAPQKEEPAKSDPIEQAKQEVRNNILISQAEKIMNSTGVDVMAALQNSRDLQVNVFANGWDMHDVYEYLRSHRNPPSPVRSSNGAHTEKASIKNMSEAQWKALQKNLDQGKRYNLRD